MPSAKPLLNAAKSLTGALAPLKFSSPVTHVYNPLEYAWKPHSQYLSRFGAAPKKILMLGMNPGPFGMAQTGVPFGEIEAVRSWMGIESTVLKPEIEHPKRPVDGFACTRSEVSGRRLWGLFGERFPDPADFFTDHFITNYCPLVFMEESGRNRTPDKIPNPEMQPVYAACDSHLRSVVEHLDPQWLVGVGGFAQKRLQSLFADTGRTITTILHPSPASPAANRGWAAAATRQLVDAGIWSS